MQTLADQQRVQQLIDQLAHDIGQTIDQRLQRGDAPAWALIGIRSRGDILAQRLAEKLGPTRLQPSRVGSLDITLYRDDLNQIAPQPIVRATNIGFNLDHMNVILVDDVLMTGRSARAALQLLPDFGRPRRVWLASLVDRGGRELPIAADYIGLDLRDQVPDPIKPTHRVQVLLEPDDDRDAIVVYDPNEKGPDS